MMSDEAFLFRSTAADGVGKDGRSGSKRVTFGMGDRERERDSFGGFRTVGALSLDGRSAFESDGVTVEFEGSFVVRAGPFIVVPVSSRASSDSFASTTGTTSVFVVVVFFSLDFCFVCLDFPGVGLAQYGKRINARAQSTQGCISTYACRPPGAGGMLTSPSPDSDPEPLSSPSMGRAAKENFAELMTRASFCALKSWYNVKFESFALQGGVSRRWKVV